MVTSFSIIVYDYFNCLVGKISWVIKVEEELLIPIRIKVFGICLSLSPLPLIIKVYFYKRSLASRTSTTSLFILYVNCRMVENQLLKASTNECESNQFWERVEVKKKKKTKMRVGEGQGEG